MSSTKKFEEGLLKIKAAEKSLKTSLLKWKPDYDVAADEYSQAATCFKNAKSFERSKECLLKAAECHQQNNAFFHAAKCIDQIILLVKDSNDYSEVAQLAEKACYLYQQHGSPESGAASLEKAAKILEQHEPRHSIRLYQKAADLVSVEDSLRQAAEFKSKVARIMVKLRMYEEAAEVIKEEMYLHQQANNIPSMGRLVVALVLVHVARGDYVAADKAFKEYGRCCEAPEIHSLEMLLQGFDSQDPDLMNEALNHPFIKHMDVEYARLARDLAFKEGSASNSVAGAGAEELQSKVKPSIGNEEDEGLC